MHYLCSCVMNQYCFYNFRAREFTKKMPGCVSITSSDTFCVLRYNTRLILTVFQQVFVYLHECRKFTSTVNTHIDMKYTYESLLVERFKERKKQRKTNIEWQYVLLLRPVFFKGKFDKTISPFLFWLTER